MTIKNLSAKPLSFRPVYVGEDGRQEPEDFIAPLKRGEVSVDVMVGFGGVSAPVGVWVCVCVRVRVFMSVCVCVYVCRCVSGVVCRTPNPCAVCSMVTGRVGRGIYAGLRAAISV